MRVIRAVDTFLGIVAIGCSLGSLALIGWILVDPVHCPTPTIFLVGGVMAVSMMGTAVALED